MSRVDDLLDEIGSLEVELEEIPFGSDPEREKNLEEQIKEKKEELPDADFLDKYGIWAYNGVSRKDFM